MPTKWNNMKSIERRKQNAANRLAERNNRTPAQQIEVLDQKFGVGVGAMKERARLKTMVGTV